MTIEMQEAQITIGGKLLTVGQSMTIRCALESFVGDLRLNGLGNDETGLKLTEAYLARIDEIRAMIADDMGQTRGDG